MIDLKIQVLMNFGGSKFYRLMLFNPFGVVITVLIFHGLPPTAIHIEPLSGFAVEMAVIAFMPWKGVIPKHRVKPCEKKI